MLQDEFLRVDALFQIGLRQQVEQAAVHQKPRLRAVAQHLQPRVLPGQRDAGEVDVGGDVFEAHVRQRIGVCQVRAVAHHGAHVALRVVVLTLGEAVVDEEGRALHQVDGQGADEGLGLGVDFGQVVVRAFNLQRRAQVGDAVLPAEVPFGLSLACPELVEGSKPVFLNF